MDDEDLKKYRISIRMDEDHYKALTDFCGDYGFKNPHRLLYILLDTMLKWAGSRKEPEPTYTISKDVEDMFLDCIEKGATSTDGRSYTTYQRRKDE